MVITEVHCLWQMNISVLMIFGFLLAGSVKFLLFDSCMEKKVNFISRLLICYVPYRYC